MFCLSISTTQLRTEVYTPLMACDKCHVIEDHPTNQCPKPPGYMACSECAGEGHSLRKCPASIKKCINCSKDHSARAMRCPVRKAELMVKRKRLREDKEVRLHFICSSRHYHHFPTPTSISSRKLLTTSLLCLLQASSCRLRASSQKHL